MNCGEVGDEREERLENAELDVDALVHAVAHGRDDEGDGGLGDGLEGDEALERAEGDGDDFRVLRRATHEDRPEQVVGLRAILDGGSSGGG